MLRDRKSTRLNSSHTVIYTLSLHDALPISVRLAAGDYLSICAWVYIDASIYSQESVVHPGADAQRSEEHTSELQSHSDLHSFPTRRSSDLGPTRRRRLPEHLRLGVHRRLDLLAGVRGPPRRRCS